MFNLSILILSQKPLQRDSFRKTNSLANCSLNSVVSALTLAKSFHIHWVSLVAQPVKNPPTMEETWVRSLGWGGLGSIPGLGRTPGDGKDYLLIFWPG